MRVVFTGTGPLTVMAAELLVKKGCEVVIIEPNQDRIDELSDQLDCGFINQDGSRPAVLREVSPENTDALLCLSDSDQDNILASLVGRSLGFKRVITKIDDPDFQHICLELKLDDVVIPDRETAKALVDMLEGREHFDLASAIKGDIRFYNIVIAEDSPATVADLELPDHTKVIALTRDDDSVVAAEDTKLAPGDEAIVITTEQALTELKKRFASDHAVKKS